MNHLWEILAVVIISILFLVYCFAIEPNMLQTKTYRIPDKKLKGLRVVFVSDFHIRPNGQKRLQKIVNLVNKQNPDIVLSGGDFVNGYREKETMPIEEIASGLNKIKSKYGFYTVLGNHDWDFDGVKISKVLQENGIKVLANSNSKIDTSIGTIYIAGVEDLKTRTPDIEKALENTENPTILLTHSPDVFPKVLLGVNLTLAGHVHGGQVRIPLWGAVLIPSKYGNRYSMGLIEETGRKIIVTKGIGTSILPVRFNCPPEIVVIDFI